MASNSNSAQKQELRELNNRVEWLDEERRKLSRRLTELEQNLTLKERELEGREQRVKDLEERLSGTSAQLSRLSHVDTQLSQFKDEVVQMIEQYDQRRIRSQTEADRLRRMEQEVIARELAEVRKELPAIGRLQNDIQLRIAEESRLAGLISEQQNRLGVVTNEVDSREGALAFLEQKEAQNGRLISDTQSLLQELSKRWEKSRDQLDLMNASLLRIETDQQEIVEEQAKMRQSLQSWMEQIQLGEYERNQRLENWQRVLVEHEEAMAQFNKEWIAFADQYKEAKMAVQTLSEWQKQLEGQQRENSELLRIESHRMQSRWDKFRQESEAKWKNFAIESDQHWSTIHRHEKQVQEQLVALDEWLEKLDQDQDLARRIQAAQADAIKRLPLLWMEEVEKAITQNPNRRRQPALIPVREE